MQRNGIVTRSDEQVVSGKKPGITEQDSRRKERIKKCKEEVLYFSAGVDRSFIHNERRNERIAS